MTSKKINITIPEKNLKEIKDFCISEKISKSWLIREATSQYIAGISKKKELEKKKKDMEWAAKTMERLREKSDGFTGEKTGTEVIREFREKR
ncbi:MAG: ribbon-helix-helix domain-containing protein [Actinomycetota bacterium]|nr:ribbon-helix-helix domain-containing protein [Actinomycetota bacterium]